MLDFRVCEHFIVRTDWGHQTKEGMKTISLSGCELLKAAQPCPHLGKCVSAVNPQTGKPPKK